MAKLSRTSTRRIGAAVVIAAIAAVVVIVVVATSGGSPSTPGAGATASGAGTATVERQNLTESALLATLGGIAGLALGAGATLVAALGQHQPFVVPLYALIAAPASGLLIGALAGVYPAMKAARLSPTEALRA
jgi:predicted lysophospholipase L1 biosynthesis ABC-type transport system permease subunit